MPTRSVSPPEEHAQRPRDPGGAPGPDRAAPPPEVREGDPGGESDGADLDWLLGLLKEAMTGVMEGDSPPLQKGNAIARLGGLYLKAYGAAELKRESTLLRKQLAQLKQRLTAVETPDTDEDAGTATPPREARLRPHPGVPVDSSAPAAGAVAAPGRPAGAAPRHGPGQSKRARRR
jgi:hypothetical protein